jgi:large subunit ribosomal protein L7/L12
MSLSNEDVVDAIGNLSVMQLIALTKELETKWGVEAVPQMVQFVSTQPEVKAETQTEFSISLVSYPADKKITLVKLVRELLGLGLLESKALVEGAPKLLKESLSKEDVEVMKTKLMEAGGVVAIT